MSDKIKSLIDTHNDSLTNVSEGVLYKHTIVTALNRTKIVSYIRKIVDDSSIFEFTDERFRNFINVERPELYLVFNLEKAIELYPYYSEALSLLKTQTETGREEDSNLDEIRNAQRSIVSAEITSKLVSFFNVVLLTIKNEGILPESNDENYEVYRKDVEEILSNVKDFKALKETITNIEKILNDNDESDDEDSRYSFGVISAVCFAVPTTEDKRIKLLVELVY